MSANRPYRPDQQILDAARHGELVVFVGAGASMLCGSPNWRGFADRVVAELEKSGALSFLEGEQLRGLPDPRRTLSIAMALARDSTPPVDINYDTILHPGKQEAIGAELYELLSALRPVFVTTNYDKWLDDDSPKELSASIEAGNESEITSGPGGRKKYYRREDLSSALLAERGAVIHLHGSYVEPESMVVSLKDYIEHYADSRVQEFLSAMFRNHTVLFVGYGLAEIEVLDYIIRSNEALRSSISEPRHFLLYACRSTESVQTRFMEQFFKDQCGVRVIPYIIDAHGHGELVEVFKDWRPELDVRAPSLLDLHGYLDRYVADPSAVNRSAALQLIESRQELAPYLINTLRGGEWFDDLDNAGYFSPDKSPPVRVLKEDGGDVLQADGWPALRYLEQIVTEARGDQAKRIAQIMRDTSADSRTRDLPNWRTLWSLATILSQLPLDEITEQDISMAAYWIRDRFGADVIGPELGEKLLPRLLESPERQDWRKALLLVDALTIKSDEEAERA